MGTKETMEVRRLRSSTERKDQPTEKQAGWEERSRAPSSSCTQTPTHSCPFQASISPEGLRGGSQARAFCLGREGGSIRKDAEHGQLHRAAGTRVGDEQLVVLNTDAPNRNHTRVHIRHTQHMRQ